MDPFELTIAQAMAQMNDGKLSSVEITKSCLERIAEVDGAVGAMLTVTAEDALRQAEAADRLRRQNHRGCLLGVPLTLKDLLCTKGVRTTCGSRILENFIPPYDATVVEQIKAQGGVVLGKTTMDEFAMGSTSETCAFGIPQNPWKKVMLPAVHQAVRRPRFHPVSVLARWVQTPVVRSANRRPSVGLSALSQPMAGFPVTAWLPLPHPLTRLVRSVGMSPILQR